MKRLILVFWVFAAIACGDDPSPRTDDRDAMTRDSMMAVPDSSPPPPDAVIVMDGGPDVQPGPFCGGGVPHMCRDGVAMGGPGCCGDLVTSAVCGGGGVGWVCPSGTIAESECVDFWVPGMCRSSRPTCGRPSDCVLLPESCCGACGVPAPDDMIAVHRDEVEENRAMACADPVACPECAGTPDPYLLATCHESACLALNLHEDPLTACVEESDCTLIANSCCACGEIDINRTIAINPSVASPYSLFCSRDDPPCPPCVPFFGDLKAECRAGRCVVVAPGP